MSESIKTIILTMEENVSSEYVEGHLIPALKLFQGVRSVDTEVVNFDTRYAMDNVRHELGEKIWEVLYPKANK